MSPEAERLIAALRDVGELEWYGSSQTAPHKVIWRWTEPQEDAGTAAQRAAETFDGRVEWAILRHDRQIGGTNWCLLPVEVVWTQKREAMRTDAEASTWLAEHRSDWVRDADADFKDVVAAIVQAVTTTR